MKETDIIYLMETLGFTINKSTSNEIYWRHFTKQIDQNIVLEVVFSETECYINIFTSRDDYDYYLSTEYDGEQQIGERINILFKSKNNNIVKHMAYFVNAVIENINEIRDIFFSGSDLCDWIVTSDDIILIIPTYPLDGEARLVSYISLNNGFVNNRA